MWLPAFIKQIKGAELLVKLEQSINLEHLKTMYNGNLSKIYAKVEIVDPRKMRPSQRRLFWALCEDIWAWNGQPKKDLEDYFKFEYAVKNDGKEISLKEKARTTASEANELLNIVTDCILENGVPVKKGYELLPRDENYFLYQCCKHRKCVICGKHADIDHIDEIGSGLNRNHVDHTKRHVIALCRIHHSERHQIGNKQFSKKYHMPLNGIKLDVETLKKIGVKGNYREEKEHDSSESDQAR
ncbi:hypothetical protein LFYK43_10820 [Ligilactobacillus salitolerans]|uniref:Uncharacterized protein n=1 Tax=Ligilactobacillus salitolerans TaxID=1808352 RepID=A0A401ISV0_9LACO|nr:putative HNHc nuclease [Ligilactobacillus salitolerans]GBG94623.1 hypothetical protein LFYK43_10820 [Ligilactobacillus salitolerans]